MEQNSGYSLWTFQGRNLKREDGIRLWNIQWRPHVVSDSLSVKERKVVLKNLKEKSIQFDLEDKSIKNAKKKSALSGFRDKQSVFNEELNAIDETMDERLNERIEWKDMYYPFKKVNLVMQHLCLLSKTHTHQYPSQVLLPLNFLRQPRTS